MKLRRHIDLKLAAKLADMSVQDFKFLNPGHNKPVIRAGEAERIVLPREKVAVFRSNFEHARPAPRIVAGSHLRAGQKPERIAAEHGMTLAELKQVNGLENKKNRDAGSRCSCRSRTMLRRTAVARPAGPGRDAAESDPGGQERGGAKRERRRKS